MAFVNENFKLINGKKYKVVDVKKESVWDYVDTEWGKVKYFPWIKKITGYRFKCNIAYFSKRYKKWITIDKSDWSDGATGAKDINSFGWPFHDELCNTGLFADGSKCNNLQASHVVSDILEEEGRWFRTNTWFVFTWLFGGQKARENGMF